MPKIKSLPPFERVCPQCSILLQYTTLKNRNQCERLQRRCFRCSRDVLKQPETRKKMSVAAKKRTGDKNPFFGKHHRKESIEACLLKRRLQNYEWCKTNEFRQQSSRPGKLNGMYGTSIFKRWIEKYGRNVANSKLLVLKEKLSKRFTGENNPMFGQPAPTGSGGGWGGWYKDWYFRSLRELSYVIYVLEKQQIEWVSCESHRIMIPYVFDGRNRTYTPDFLVDGNKLVEIKPKQLMEIGINCAKRDAAKVYCDDKGWIFSMVDVKNISLNELIQLHRNGLVRFNKKYEARMGLLCQMKKLN
jgi:hypothetical protein